MGYAAGTTVSSAKTMGEIQGMLAARGVVKVATMTDPEKFTLAFEFEGVPYRMTLPTPDPASPEFSQYYRGSVLYERSDSQKKKLYEKEVNCRWRAFGMVIKAKLVAVEEGISTIAREFIGDAVLASGQTFREAYADDLPKAIADGKLAGALALGGGR